ncbi:hypothetical protein CRM22_007084 [Opisthorchis felineus]|uniref:Uncharacterized protein n=1 Tax=Opisthorchis felineus TaxID=147828 RepID=A0A4S2LHP0_OPIFE|nr:hypothetical protein CRM22_007084 [Opisthorchis felineus]
MDTATAKSFKQRVLNFPDCLDCGFAFFYAYPKCNIRLGGSESTTQSSQISDDSTAPIIGSCVFEMNETSDASEQGTVSIRSPIPNSQPLVQAEEHQSKTDYDHSTSGRTKFIEIMRVNDVGFKSPTSSSLVLKKPVIPNGELTSSGIYGQSRSFSSSLYPPQCGFYKKTVEDQSHIKFPHNRFSAGTCARERAPNGRKDSSAKVSQIPRLVNSAKVPNARQNVNSGIYRNTRPSPPRNPPSDSSTGQRKVNSGPRILSGNGGTTSYSDRHHCLQQPNTQHPNLQNTAPNPVERNQSPITVTKEFLIVNGQISQEENDRSLVQEEQDDKTINSDMSDFDEEKYPEDPMIMNSFLVDPIHLNEISTKRLSHNALVGEEADPYQDRAKRCVGKRKNKPVLAAVRAYAERCNNRQGASPCATPTMNGTMGGWFGNPNQVFLDNARHRGRYAEQYQSTPNIQLTERVGPQNPVVITRPRRISLLDGRGQYLATKADFRSSVSALSYLVQDANFPEGYLEDDDSDSESCRPYPVPPTSSLGYHNLSDVYPRPPLHEVTYESDPSVLRPRLPQFHTNLKNRLNLYHGRRFVHSGRVPQNPQRPLCMEAGTTNDSFIQPTAHYLSSPEKNVVDPDSTSTSENEEIRPLPRRMLSPDEYAQMQPMVIRPNYHSMRKGPIARRTNVWSAVPPSSQNGTTYSRPRWIQYLSDEMRTQGVVYPEDGLDDVQLDIEDPRFQTRLKLSVVENTRTEGSSHYGRLSVEPVAVDSSVACYNGMHADVRYPQNFHGLRAPFRVHNSMHPLPPQGGSSVRAKSECDLVAIASSENAEWNLHPDSYIRNRPNYRLGFNGNYYPKAPRSTNTNVNIVNNTNNSKINGIKQENKAGRSVSLERFSSGQWVEHTSSEISSINSSSKNLNLEPPKVLCSPPTSPSIITSSCNAISKISTRAVSSPGSSRLTVAWVEMTDRERQSDKKLYRMILQLPPDRRHAVGFVLLLMGIRYNEEGELSQGGLEHRLREALELVSPTQRSVNGTGPVGGAGDCARLKTENVRLPNEIENSNSHRLLKDPRMTQSCYQSSGSTETDAYLQNSNRPEPNPQLNGRCELKMTTSCTSIEDSSDTEQTRGESDDQPNDSLPSTATILRRLARTLAVRIAFKQQHLADAQQKVARNETEEKWLRNKLNELFNPSDRFSFSSSTPTRTGDMLPMTDFEDSTATQVITRFDRWHKNMVSVVQLLCQLARRLACVDARILSLQQNGFRRDSSDTTHDSQFSLEFLNRQKVELEFKIREAQSLRAGLENCRLRLLESIPPGLKVEDPSPELIHGYESTDSAIGMNERENESDQPRATLRSDQTTKPTKHIPVFLRDRISVHLLHTLQWLVTYHVLDTKIRVDQDLRDSVLDDLRLEMNY